MWGVFSGRVGWRKPLVMSVSWKIQGVKFWDLGDILVGDVPEAEKVVRSIGCGVSFIGKLGAETHFCTQIGFWWLDHEMGFVMGFLNVVFQWKGHQKVVFDPMVFGGWNAKL